jgi:crotonobetainyl-CoA:carnitine CoA-transferase CaiB-like acyl-CoA transferase
MEEVVHSRQFQFREFLVDVEHPAAGTVTQPGPAIRFHGTPWRIARAAPLLGEHTEDVLCKQLGYSHEQVRALERDGVIRTAAAG